MTPIAFMDLKSQARRLKAEIAARIDVVLEHGAYINGPEIAELESALAALTGAGATVACSSGTDALVIPLMALGVEAGDAVFVPAFTYNATANAVLLAGGVPVFVDIDSRTFNMDAGHLADQIARRVLAQLSDRVIRETVVDLVSTTAERLVREEIDRIRRNIK